MAQTFINLPAHNQPEQVVEIPAEQGHYLPNQAYAIRFHRDDEVRGFTLLSNYATKIAGMRGRIFLVFAKDLQPLDIAGIKYDRFEMRGRYTPEEIITHWDAQAGKAPAAYQSGAEAAQRPSLAKALVDCIRDWYASR